jgi:hypothetical protein
MAKKVVYTDDLDDSPNAETVTFSFQGAQYEIDLGKRNTTAFEKVLAPYIRAARKVSGRTASPPIRRGQPAKADRQQLQAIREWARANGYPVSDRGRIATEIQEAYRAAN